MCGCAKPRFDFSWNLPKLAVFGFSVSPPPLSPNPFPPPPGRKGESTALFGLVFKVEKYKLHRALKRRRVALTLDRKQALHHAKNNKHEHHGSTRRVERATFEYAAKCGCLSSPLARRGERGWGRGGGRFRRGRTGERSSSLSIMAGSGLVSGSAGTVRHLQKPAQPTRPKPVNNVT